MNINFKKLEIDDLPLMLKWLNTDHVVKWYMKKESTMEDVKAKYTPKITGAEPTKPFIILIDEAPVGYIQEYYLKDDPELEKYVSGNTAGLDLFIGDPEYINKGFGPLVVKEFVKQVVFAEKRIDTCLVDPSPNNLRMIKANEKVGFKYLTTTTGPDPKYLMTITRKDFNAQ